jgi:hypothetical protein
VNRKVGLVACQGSAAAFFGQKLLAETEESNVQAYQNSFAERPEWQHTLTPVRFPLLPGGMPGCTPDQARALAPFWQGDLTTATHQEWLPEIRRQDQTVQLEIDGSTGGTGILGTLPLDAYTAEYPQARRYYILPLPDGDNYRRENVPALLDAYFPRVHGTVLLESGPERDVTDQYWAQLRTAMVTARWIDPGFPTDHNVFADVFRNHPFATIRGWAGKAPAYYLGPYQDQLPEQYFTSGSFAEAALTTGVLEVLRNPRRQALPLAAATSGPRYLYAVAPVRPDELAGIAERVRRNVAGVLGSNTLLGFASIGTPLIPDIQEVDLAVVAIFPLAADLQTIKDYVSAVSQIPEVPGGNSHEEPIAVVTTVDPAPHRG